MLVCEKCGAETKYSLLCRSCASRYRGQGLQTRLCVDCDKKLSPSTKGIRCRDCYEKSKKPPPVFCKDCEKKITRRTKTGRCKRCSHRTKEFREKSRELQTERWETTWVGKRKEPNHCIGCGKEISSLAARCGPCSSEARRKSKVGNRYGKLLVMQRADYLKLPDGNRLTQWLCRCDCGNEAIIRDTNLQKKAGSKSCGCAKIEAARKRCQKGLVSLDPDAPYRLFYRKYKNDAQTRGLDFRLSFKTFKALVEADCHYCGAGPSMIQKTSSRGTNKGIVNGIDRQNNDLGYIEGNCVSCCSSCNRAKWEMTIDEFKTWLRQIYSFYMGGK